MGGLFSCFSRPITTTKCTSVCSSDKYLYHAECANWRPQYRFIVRRYNPLTKEWACLFYEDTIQTEEFTCDYMDITVVNDKFMLLLITGPNPQSTKVYTVQLIKPRRLDEIVCTGPSLETDMLLQTFPASIFSCPHSSDVFYALSFGTSTGVMQLYTLEIDQGTKTGMWKTVVLTNHMPTREVMDCVLYNDTIYIFDNVDLTQPGAQPNNYMMLDALDMKNKRWHAITPFTVEAHWPTERVYQSIIQHNGIIYMLGGVTKVECVQDRWVNSEFSDEVWALNLARNEWKLLPTRLPIRGAYGKRQTSMVTLDGALITWGLGTNTVGPDTLSIKSVRPPTLKSLAMHKMMQAAPILKTMPLQKLLAVGVPRDLAQFITDGSRQEGMEDIAI